MTKVTTKTNKMWSILPSIIRFSGRATKYLQNGYVARLFNVKKFPMLLFPYYLTPVAAPPKAHFVDDALKRVSVGG